MCKPGNSIREETCVDDASLKRTLTASRSAFLGFLVKRLGNRPDAEDVLQEFCIRVLSRRDQLREAERMDAWLYAVLRSTLNDHFRKAGRSKRLSDAVLLETRSAAVAEDPVEEMNEICKCVKGLVTELRPPDAELIRRIDIDDTDRTVLATELGLKPGTLNVRLHRARAALRDALLAHCGPCCRSGFDDCSCPSAEYKNHVDAEDCRSNSPTV